MASLATTVVGLQLVESPFDFPRFVIGGSQLRRRPLPGRKRRYQTIELFGLCHAFQLVFDHAQKQRVAALAPIPLGSVNGTAIRTVGITLHTSSRRCVWALHNNSAPV